MTSKISLHGDKCTLRHSKRTTERRSSLTFLCRRASRPRVYTHPLPRPHTPEPTASLRSTAGRGNLRAGRGNRRASRGRGAWASPLRSRSTKNSPPAALERPVERGRAWRASPPSRFREPGPASGYSRCCSGLGIGRKVRRRRGERAAGWERAALPAERREPGRQEADTVVRGGAEGR